MGAGKKITSTLTDLISRIIFGREPSSVEETVMGTGDAALDDQTRRDIEAIQTGELNLDYYLNTYKTAVVDMRAKQEDFSKDALEALVRIGIGFAGAAGLDYALPMDIPATSIGVGAYAGMRGIVLFHKYNRFKRSKTYAIGCADELKKYISDNRDGLLNSGDSGIQTIVSEAEGMSIGGTNQEQYRQLEHFDSVIKTVQFNRALINGNTKKIEATTVNVEHASGRLREVEGGMLKHKYQLAELGDRVAKVEKYTYCTHEPAIPDNNPKNYDVPENPQSKIQLYKPPIGISKSEGGVEISV